MAWRRSKRRGKCPVIESLLAKLKITSIGPGIIYSVILPTVAKYKCEYDFYTQKILSASEKVEINEDIYLRNSDLKVELHVPEINLEYQNPEWFLKTKLMNKIKEKIIKSAQSAWQQTVEEYLPHMELTITSIAIIIIAII